MTSTASRLEAERTIDLEVYEANGHPNRVSYLEELAENIGVTLFDIEEYIDMLGPEEDFDGLVVFLEDHGDQI